MTAIVAHQPSQRLPMSPVNANARRLSARIQEKEASTRAENGTASASRAQASAASKKRKAAYEEEEDGFAFTRVKKTKNAPPDAVTAPQPAMLPVHNEAKMRIPITNQGKPTSQPEELEKAQRRRQRMSFSTPKPKEVSSQRRSKRLSDERVERNGSPVPELAPKIVRKKRTAGGESKSTHAEEGREQLSTTTRPPPASPRSQQAPSNDNAATKIALPVSDTPVIRRNKAMREGRGSRGERRSSLGLRGRRASSLIDTGNSNALPHREVPIEDFYKHIEGDLIEPRRMRQLLTWCATRAIHAKPQGSEFDDVHKIMSARAIEEELLKELANNSTLSDWFVRDDGPMVKDNLPERPNPKNIQNAAKITELEERIERLRIEKNALEALLKSDIPVEVTLPKAKREVDIDKSLLCDADVAALEMLRSTKDYSIQMAQRVNHVTMTLGPTVDTFADGIHKIAQYRTAADNVASRVLSVCAEKFAQRESEGRKKALQLQDDRSPARDMSHVLRGLSRVDR